jgi:uncharacterized membrane protein
VHEILSNWLFFALLAPFLWAIANFIEKYSLGKYAKDAHEFVFFSSLASWALFVILVITFGLPQISALWLAPITLGVIFVAAYWFYGKALRVTETSQLIISFKLIPVLTLFFAYLLFGQKISVFDTLAFIIVLVGTLFVSVKKTEGAFRITQGTKWIAGAILIWGLMFVGVDWALTKMTFWHYLTLEVFGNCIAGTSLLLLPQIRNELIDSLKSATGGKYFWYGLIKVIDFLGQILIKRAFVLGPSAGLVTVVMQVQSVYCVVIGVSLTIWLPHIIEEDISKENIANKVFGIAVALIGICLLFLK